MQMKITKGSEFTPFLECINTYKNIWKVRIKICENEDGGVDYVEEEYNYQPTLAEIKDFIITYYNSQCDKEILTGCNIENDIVWLSQENQQNYLRDLNLAKITGGENLPVTYKVGESNYITFESIEELQDFNIKVANHINSTIKKYWDIKDSIDWNTYLI